MDQTVRKFKDREEAGQFLADKLGHLAADKPYIFALPRGGIPVAEPIARKLDRPLYVMLVKRITAPDQPELAIGAIAEDKQPVWNEKILKGMGISDEERGRLLVKAQQALHRQQRLWKTESQVTDLNSQTVILVDDGLATGATLLTAIDFLKKRNPRKIIVAIPTGSPQAVKRVSASVDEVVCPISDESSHSVSQAYQNFDQVSDRTVSEILERTSISPNPLLQTIVKNSGPSGTEALRLLELMSP